MKKIYSHLTKKIVDEKSRILVGYLLAGYKDKDNFFKSVEVLDSKGVDIIEIGYPSDNPYADGEVISSAHSMVDKDVSCSLEFWQETRSKTQKAIWLMAYSKDFLETGKYIEFAKAGVMDGIVIPDADYNLRLKVQSEIAQYGVDVIGFVNPSMNSGELCNVFDDFTMVYAQLYVGQTGMKREGDSYHDMLDFIKSDGRVIAFAGFGLNSASKVNKVLNEGFAGAIVGTELIKKLNNSMVTLEDFVVDIVKVV